MNGQIIFKRSLLVSCAVHVILFLFPFHMSMHQKQEPVPEPKTEFIAEERSQIIKDMRREPDMIPEPPPFIPIADKLPTLDKIMEKAAPLDNSAEIEKNESVLEEFTDMPSKEPPRDDPAYMNYYEMIRQKIKANALKRYDRTFSGRVRLFFTVHSNGAMSGLRIDSDGKSSDVYLKEIASESIHESVPFPPFPESLENYPSIKFDMSIYFKR